MAKRAQKSKRARKAKKQAQFAGLLANTGHPSHIHQGDRVAEKRVADRKWKNLQVR